MMSPPKTCGIPVFVLVAIGIGIGTSLRYYIVSIFKYIPRKPRPKPITHNCLRIHLQYLYLVYKQVRGGRCTKNAGILTRLRSKKSPLGREWPRIHFAALDASNCTFQECSLVKTPIRTTEDAFLECGAWRDIPRG